MAFSETSSPSTFQQLSAPSGFTLMAVTSMISTYWNLPLMTPAAQTTIGSEVSSPCRLLSACADQCFSAMLSSSASAGIDYVFFCICELFQQKESAIQYSHALVSTALDRGKCIIMSLHWASPTGRHVRERRGSASRGNMKDLKDRLLDDGPYESKEDMPCPQKVGSSHSFAQVMRGCRQIGSELPHLGQGWTP